MRPLSKPRYYTVELNVMTAFLHTKKYKISLVKINFLTNLVFNPYSAGIDGKRQNLTSVDVRFSRLKSIPAL